MAWRPEWPVAVLVGIAWALLALLSFQGDGSHAGHALGPTALGSTASPLATSPFTSWATAWTNAWPNASWLLMSWLLMSFAMMVPATLPAVRHVALNSLDARRARAMTLYVAAYLAVWGLFGIAAFALVGVSQTLLGFATNDRALLAIVLAIATGWQLTRIKRRAIVACRRTVPLPPDGLRADRACVRFGVMQAWRCLLACWPLMLLMAAMPHPHPLLPMLALTAIVLLEERARYRDRLIIPNAWLFAAATIAGVFAP